MRQQNWGLEVNRLGIGFVGNERNPTSRGRR
jgi:hypothetical protein